MSNVIFYHAGCPVCFETEQMVVNAIDRSKYEVKAVYLGEQAERSCWVKSVPALVLNGQSFHINFSASIDDLK